MDDHFEYLAKEAAVLTEEICEVFRGVSRAGGVSWAGSEVIDMYGMVAGEPIYHDRDQTWQELVDDPEWNVEPGVGGYAFLDNVGFRYFLPAGMIRCIRAGYDVGIGSWLTLHDGFREHTLEKWSLLDDPQRVVVARFLIYMAAFARAQGDEEESDKWRALFDGTWADPALTRSSPSPSQVKKHKKRAPPREVW